MNYERKEWLWYNRGERRGNICPMIKSRSLKESETCLSLMNYSLTFCHKQILNEDLVRDTDILVEALPRYRKTFSLLTITWIVFFFLCFFLLFNKIIVLLILLTETRQFRVLFFVVEESYLSKTLYLRGKACHLAVLTFDNSPITHLVALECGSAWEMVISVTLNSVQ